MTEMLDAAAKRIESADLAHQPEVRAELERIIAASYYGQGNQHVASDHMQRYVDLESTILASNSPKMVSIRAIHAGLLFGRGELAQAEKAYRAAIPRLQVEQKKGTVSAEDLFPALNNFAYLRRTQGDSKEAESLFRESLALAPYLPQESRFLLNVTRSTLASTLADEGRFDEALQTAGEAVTEDRRTGQTDTPGFGFSLTILGGFLVDQQDFPGADAALGEGERIFRKFLGPSHLWLGDNLRNQAISYYHQGRFAEAQSKVSETLKIYRENFGPQYDHYPTALIAQGLILAETGHPKEGETILHEAVKLRSESLLEEHYWVALAKEALGEGLITQQRFGEAEPFLMESYKTLTLRLGQRDPRTKEAARQLVNLYELWHKPQEAEPYRQFL